MPESQKSVNREGGFVHDPSRGRRLKYHGAYAANPDFDNQSDPQIIPVSSTYENSPLVVGRESEDLGAWGGRQGSHARVIAAASRYDGDLSSNTFLQEEMLDGLSRVDETAVHNATVANGGRPVQMSPQLQSLMAEARRESSGVPSRRHAAGVNPTHIPEGGHNAFIADRSEEGTPGMGDEYDPEDRYPFDKRPFVEASPKAGRRTFAQDDSDGDAEESFQQEYDDPRDPMFGGIPEDEGFTEGLDDPMDSSMASRRTAGMFEGEMIAKWMRPDNSGHFVALYRGPKSGMNNTYSVLTEDGFGEVEEWGWDEEAIKWAEHTYGLVADWTLGPFGKPMKEYKRVATTAEEIQPQARRQAAPQRNAPGVVQRRPTFRPSINRQAAPIAPPRQAPVPVEAMKQRAMKLLREAEIASATGQHGKAAVLERQAAQIVETLEGRRTAGRQGSAGPRLTRPVPPPSGFQQSSTRVPMDDEDIQSGFGGY